MKRKQTDLDGRIVDGLRADAAPVYDAKRLGALASRIENAARPFLEQRRLGRREGKWWDFAAEWAGMLIPVGVTVAAASIVLLWLARPVVPSSREFADTSPTFALSAARVSESESDFVDLAVDEIVRPPRSALASVNKR